MQGSGIRDTAIRKQNAAMYYYEQRDYEKAKELCEEAIELWNKLKGVPIKSTSEWAIDHNIARCKHILNKEKVPAEMAPPQAPKVSEKPQPDLDQFVARIKEKEEAKKRAKDALVRDFKRLLQDLEKYKKIVNSDLGQETKLAAWRVLINTYPQWSGGVQPGDSDALLSRALATRPRLAIFPSILRQERGEALDDITIIDTAIDALSQVKADVSSFGPIYSYYGPIYSYYDLGNKHKTIKIGQNIMTDAVVDDLWIRKSFFSDKEPNVDLICQVGKQLKVDAVLLYYIIDRIHDDDVKIFLINVKTGKKYYAEDRIDFRSDSGVLLFSLKHLTEKIITDYEGEELK